MVYKGYTKTYDFRKFKAERVSGNNIKNSIINMRMVKDWQNHLAKYIEEFKTKTKPQNNSNFKKVK